MNTSPSRLVAIAILIGSSGLQSLFAITISPTQNQVSVNEGNGGSFSFLVTNNTSSAHQISGLGFSVFPTMGADVSDDVMFGNNNPLTGGFDPASTCVFQMVLNANATCNLILPFTTPLTNPPGMNEPDHDWGVTRSNILVGFDDGTSALASVFVTVNDTPLPPPAPLLTIGDASVNEGDNGVLPFSITSTAGVMQVVSTRMVSAVAIGPDFTDDVSLANTVGCDVGTLLFPGIPCLGSIIFTTPKTMDEGEDVVNGLNSVQLTVALDGGAPILQTGVISVNDVATPEPGTQWLWALGMLFITVRLFVCRCQPDRKVHDSRTPPTSA